MMVGFLVASTANIQFAALLARQEGPALKLLHGQLTREGGDTQL